MTLKCCDLTYTICANEAQKYLRLLQPWDWSELCLVYADA